MSQKAAGAETTLRRALWAGFETLRDEADGKAPAGPIIKSRFLAIEQAWSACREAPRLYAETQAAWRTATGRCPVGTEPEPCVCRLESP